MDIYVTNIYDTIHRSLFKCEGVFTATLRISRSSSTCTGCFTASKTTTSGRLSLCTERHRGDPGALACPRHREKGSTTRTVLLKLKPGFKVDDLCPTRSESPGSWPSWWCRGGQCSSSAAMARETFAGISGVPRCSKCRRHGHTEADCVGTHTSATGILKLDDSDKTMDVVEAEETARGTDEAAKRTDSPDTSAHADGDPPNGDAPTRQGSTNDTTGSTGDAPAPQVHPAASSGGDTGNGVVPAREH
ncbi:hypothetical protein HPB50_027990 [Hyalomma asiaticum]|nr:hypothetical protein HPB50_027990 [Hyalomma asiaticum]